MREIFQKRLSALKEPRQKEDALREGLQHLILKILDDRGYFKQMAFMGGTALRILYDLPRFSEDMDFSLQKTEDPRFDCGKMLSILQDDLSTYQFPVDLKTKREGAVQGAFLKFSDILLDYKISKRKGEKLHIKLEVDTRPPPGAGFATTPLQKEFLFTVVHHDLPSLFTGKIMAFLFRNYTKGRDVYDLLWYATRKTAINRQFLESSLAQATGQATVWSEKELVEKITQKIKDLDMAVVLRDALPFMDRPEEKRFFEKELLIQAVQDLRYKEL